ncbi:LPXTG-motif cell wall-anchored protein [Diaminobutyricimonas aerilata]|uniref:LPXTG-motif cell wall-anchored protein n=1 Tax=Diaminobutyricimonas aerilata TaxID=1162967 RepID=A0A2M9CK68_9MICO|nr:choice-of-anchor I family protein [Diaminobutyricimonas aerilata]PJJ72289.1 LPXTG-motif cell wall-anchored protein [Diaminobutyricimonas aerilata]
MRRRPVLPALALVAAAPLALLAAQPASAALVPSPPTVSADDAALTLAPIGTYESGVFEEGAAEIVAYYAAGQRLLVVNAVAGSVEVLDVSDPTAPVSLFSYDIASEFVGVANSVAVRADGLAAVAVEAAVKTDPGRVVFFDAAGNGAPLGSVEVGALPDMLTFTPDGTRVVVANEAEPDKLTNTIDPQGTVSIVSVPSTVSAPAQEAVQTVDFLRFDPPTSAPLPEGVRVYGGVPGSATPIADSLEPEYITVDSSSSRAYVTLQEANAIAEIDLDAAELLEVRPLGFKDWSADVFDGSDEDGPLDEKGDPTGLINLASWPVLGIYSPDAIASYSAGGSTYLVTANEGDAREWGENAPNEYLEEERVEDLTLCSNLDPALQTDAAIGRLNVSIANGYDADQDCYSELYTLGGRSFSIWSADGTQVFDSGSDFERITAELLPEFFNSDHAETEFDSRSDSKGPEPEGITLGEVGGRTYAFIGLERIGGVMVYDITSPTEASFVTYVNNRDFEADLESPEAGDLGPEGLTFITAADSPTGAPMLAVGNEVSGTTTLYSITAAATDPGTVPPIDPNTGGPAGELAATGAETAGAVLLGALALVGGLALLLVRRRRTA